MVTVDVWPDAATAARFLKNVRASANARKVDVRKGDSALRVAELLLAGREFDFIYVDGSHRATDVLLDVSLAWRLLRSDGRGVMLLDDYARGEPAPPSGPLSLDEGADTGDARCARRVRDAGELSMTEAIDAVLSSAPGGAEVLYCGYLRAQATRARPHKTRPLGQPHVTAL